VGFNYFCARCMKLSHFLTRISQFVVVAGVAAGLSACAAETIPYPTLSTAKKLKNKLLSREEQKEVIRDLETEQAQHESTAIKAIERSP
jgi:hypothetical protein